jgi:archaellum biogenesis protein FlaJ (TadC family)
MIGSSSFRSMASRADRVLYALFSRHADRPRHDSDRGRYRGTTLSVDFETFLARLYGLSWAIGVGCIVGVLAFGSVGSTGSSGRLSVIVNGFPAPISEIPLLEPSLPLGGVVVLAVLAKRGTVAVGMFYLRWHATLRRAAIERSLPGAVRYLRALADGSKRHQVMLRKVAMQDAYGETGVALGRVVETAALTGSLDRGLRTVARETPSREILAPFLLKFREHSNQGPGPLQEFLRMESRMLSQQRSRARQRAGVYLKFLAKVFIVLLGIPAFFVIVSTISALFTPELSRTTSVAGAPTLRALIIYGSSAFVLLVGILCAVLLAQIRPSNYGRLYQRPTGLETLPTATSNPASGAFVFAFPAVVAGWLLWTFGTPTVNVLLFSYAAYGFPVGAVAVKRDQMDNAKDREIRDFIHAVAGHVRLGKPFGAAVETVAREVDFGPLNSDIDGLAFRLGLTTGLDGTNTRKEALDRFVDRVGTPLAEQTVGLVTGALDVGSNTDAAFETLQTEVGALYHQRQKLRSTMFIYAAIGWTTALAVVVLVVASSSYVLGGVTQLAVGSGNAGIAASSGAVDADRVVWQLYLFAESMMLACGWFAGVASRGRYEALLHSSALVLIGYLLFAGIGLI